MYQDNFISVIIPALNEESSIGTLIAEIPEYVDQIIVGDNGSTDKTSEIAALAGALVVTETKRGYGAACLRALRELDERTDIVVFLDADYSDYPAEMDLLLAPITNDNYEIVIGSRMLGAESRNALPPVARFGNWLSTRLIKLFFGYKFSDLGPFRAIKKTSFDRLDMQDQGFGWTVELQIKAAKLKMKATETAVSYRNRIGQSKISGTLMGSLKAGCKILFLIFRELLRK